MLLPVPTGKMRKSKRLENTRRGVFDVFDVVFKKL
uniref:Uncharacterized protein n=1 Tax=Anguilla anguilla TaxID=7936 RepID=A0A0E9XIQ1_ANGAN